MPKKKELTPKDYIKSDIEDIAETMLLLSKMDNGQEMIHSLSVVANLLYESQDMKTAARVSCDIKHGKLLIQLRYNVK
jgi:ABC-type Fe3+-citrate transport system substrate-binding protein